jgi:hypothetical protein
VINCSAWVPEGMDMQRLFHQICAILSPMGGILPKYIPPLYAGDLRPHTEIAAKSRLLGWLRPVNHAQLACNRNEFRIIIGEQY